MNRRAFLTTAGLSLGTLGSGCLGASGTTDDPVTTEPEIQTVEQTSTTPDSKTSTTTSTTMDDIIVEDIGVRKAVKYESIMGSGGVFAADSQQYVVASVRSGQELSAADFSFVTNDQSWEPGLPDSAGSINRSVAGREGGPIDRSFGKERSYLAFSVPSPLSASNPRIEYTGSTSSKWSLPSGAQDSLAASAPRFELETLAVPNEISQGETLSVSLTATNVSETAGRFLAALYWPTKRIADDDESHIVEHEVAAGEEFTVSLDIDTEYTTGQAEPVALSIQGHVTAEREIQVREGSTTS